MSSYELYPDKHESWFPQKYEYFNIDNNSKYWFLKEHVTIAENCFAITEINKILKYIRT